MSLYLKYRSANFDDIVEQDFTKTILKQQIIKSFAGEEFSNYLFYGSRGIGKTSIARIMAKALNCLNNSDGNPCNECESCLLISKNKTMDIIEIDAASHTGVDNIREEIIGKSIYPPVQLRKKVTIIDEVHMLSTGAFNALLKIMEEPPKYLVFILATTEFHKVPETITSRCQVFNFKRITMNGIIGRLEFICKKEGFAYERSGLEIIARIADGGMRDAVKYLDQVSILGMIDEKTVSQCLGVTSESVIKGFLENYNQKNSVALIEIITNLQQDGVDVFIFLKEILNYVDRNLNTDSLPLLLPIAGFIKTCYEKLKYFPHPYVLLKSEVAQLGNVMESAVVPILQKEKVIEKVNLAHSQPENSDKMIPENRTLISGGNESNEFDELKDRIVSNIASPSLKSIRESACHIEKLDTRSLIVQVIEKGKMTLLTLGKNKQDVEKICSEVLARDIVLEYQFLDKEEFLRKGLDGMLA